MFHPMLERARVLSGVPLWVSEIYVLTRSATLTSYPGAPHLPTI